jgi:glycosyltransferase involved in cell wall biosynthesis
MPVATTPHGGIPEAVTDGISGMLIPEQDDEALAAGLLSLAAYPAQFAALGANASRAVAANWEINAQTRLLESIYDEARHRKHF